MSETKERKREIGLRVIGLCMVYIRGLEKGSEREREAYRMLAMYRESYRRETGEVATELMVIEAMRRRRVEMEEKSKASAEEGKPVENSLHPNGRECRAVKRPCPLLQKGTTRENKTPGENRKVYKLNQRQSMHNQIRDLSQIIERSSRDGEHMEAVLYRPEFGELTLDCGRPGKKNDPVHSGGHGVKHALEERHGISPSQIAETLLKGKVVPSSHSDSRLEVLRDNKLVVLETEIKKGSGRASKTSAKIHTASTVK